MSEHARKRARAVLRGRDDGNITLLPDRSYVGWYRHMTLVLLTQAFLTGICIQPLVLAAPTADSCTSLSIPLLSLTTPEVRHVLARLIWPPPSSTRLVLSWSWWRRSHRSRASYFHTRRRLEAG